MSTKLASLIAGRPLEVQLVNGETLRFYRKRFGTEVTKAVRELSADESLTVQERIARQLALMIESWDVVNESGAMVPVSIEILAQLDAQDLVAMDRAIGEDINPNSRRASESPETSDAGSPPEEKSGKRRSGTRS